MLSYVLLEKRNAKFTPCSDTVAPLIGLTECGNGMYHAKHAIYGDVRLTENETEDMKPYDFCASKCKKFISGKCVDGFKEFNECVIALSPGTCPSNMRPFTLHDGKLLYVKDRGTCVF